MHIRQMTEADVAAGMRLSGQNGWNQLERDWRRFLSMQANGCFLAEIDGQTVGTACACIFNSVAWVALVLVDVARRKQGIGTALMQEVLQFLDDCQIPTVRLDATPLGRPIYERLGFAAEYELARFDGVPLCQSSPDVPMASFEQFDAICSLDQEVSGTHRRKFLERLFDEAPQALRAVVSENRLRGFLGSRPGARAAQIGPCIADATAGPVLLADAFRRLSGQRVYIDIPLAHARAAQLAQAAGLTVQRNLLRMTRGQRLHEKIDWLWASSGPEKG